MRFNFEIGILSSSTYTQYMLQHITQQQAARSMLQYRYSHWEKYHLQLTDEDKSILN